MKKLDEKQKIEKERIQKEKEKIESLEKTRRQKEGHLNLEQEKIKRTEGRMFEVKTNKEYQALLSEIEAIKEANSRRKRRSSRSWTKSMNSRRISPNGKRKWRSPWKRLKRSEKNFRRRWPMTIRSGTNRWNEGRSFLNRSNPNCSNSITR